MIMIDEKCAFSYLFLEPLGMRSASSDVQLQFNILYDPLLFGINEKHSARFQATLQIKEYTDNRHRTDLTRR